VHTFLDAFWNIFLQFLCARACVCVREREKQNLLSWDL
jgi:hypothetical protein